MNRFDWRREISPEQWRTLLAAHMGWALDGMDVMLYSFALLTIRHEFSLSSARAGALASVTLVASAAGGVAAGVLADRVGRVRVLVYSILLYSLFTGATATAATVGQLVLWRTFVGLGLGAEWSAGSVLVAESWPARHRGKAVGLMQSGWAVGVILAAMLAAAVLPRFGWRPLFVLGVLPALLTFWVRRNVPESTVWRKLDKQDSPGFSDLLEPTIVRRAVLATALTTCLLFAYWGLFTWIPGYLTTPLEKGGAGMTAVTSLGFIIPMQLGAFLGYNLFGFLADDWGRKPVFLGFVLGAALIVPLYALCGRSQTILFLLGPLVGFFGQGYFSVFGAMLAELFPSKIRATAQGLCYNLGRALSAAAPMTIGWLADRYGIGAALSVTSAFFAAAGALIVLLPKTDGAELS